MMLKPLMRAVLGVLFLAFSIPAFAHTPEVFDPNVDQGQDFTTVPAGTGAEGISPMFVAFTDGTQGLNNQFWFGGASGLWIMSANYELTNKGQPFPSSGFMTPTSTCAAGFGYGTYHWAAQVGYAPAQTNQNPGANLILWNADGTWVNPAQGTQLSEVDALETWMNNVSGLGAPFQTMHFYAAGWPSNDGYMENFSVIYPPGTDYTSYHDYDVVWGPDSLTMYIDGIPEMGAPPGYTPLDYAHGGCNKTLGAQLAMQSKQALFLPTAQLLLQNAWWTASQVPPGL